MTEQLPDRVRRAFDALDVDYDADDLEHGVGRLHARVRERRTRRVVTGALLAIAIVASVTILARHSQQEGITLADGTRCTPVGASGKVTLVHEDKGSVVLRVEQGTVRFSVAKQHDRRFEVEAGDVTVHVVGTVFDIERVGDSAHVVVSEGRVEVTHAKRMAAAVSAGESWSPHHHAAAAEAPVETAAGSASSSSAASSAPATASGPAPASASGSTRISSGSPSTQSSTGNAGKAAWRALARSGEYQRAFAALKTKGSDPPADSPEDLFLAADSARLSGHPAEAVPFLTAIMDKHATDARGDLAAFTLARIYLESLGDPTAAARAFARARQLAPRGELAEDALGREAEAWRRAGDLNKARERARSYLDSYPKGQRVDAMRELVSTP